MCGRNSLIPSAIDLESRFDAALHFESYRPRFNISPGDDLAVITSEQPDLIKSNHWGIRPHWMGESGSALINARSETVAQKRSFRDAWEHRPCLVLSSGFYEWQSRRRGPKQPYRIYRVDDVAFAFAGLWEPQTAHTGDTDAVTILTTDANETVAPIHDRMPVILPSSEEATWLEGTIEERQELCRPYPNDDLESYPISTRVNDPTNDDATIIDPIDDPQTGLGAFS